MTCSFNKVARNQNAALDKSGFQKEMKYLLRQLKKGNRRKKIIAFNLPYTANVKSKK